MKGRSRLTERLKAKHLPLLQPGDHHDGGGLFLRIKQTGARHWLQRLTIKGQRVNRGLGPYPLVSLALARKGSHEARLSARDGKDVAVERRLAAAKATTFKEAFADFFAVKAKTLKNAEHRALRASTMEDYVFPAIGRTPVGDVTTTDIIKILKPIWVDKAETAKRVAANQGRFRLRHRPRLA